MRPALSIQLRPVNGATVESAPAEDDASCASWRAVKFFLLAERDHAERYADRLRAKEDGCVRVVPCSGRGLRVEVGADERRIEQPVERDRRARAA